MSDSIDIERLGVFQIFTGGGTGTAFLIDPQTLVTNCHVVEPFRQVAVELRDKTRVLGTVRRVSPQRDLAIVEIAKPLSEDVLTVAQGDDLKAKQVVNIIGFPVGLPLSLTAGVVSNPRQLLDGSHYVQTDAAINPGNSGGPILNADKQLVAVTTCKLRQADNVGFGIPAADVNSFIKGFREQTAAFGLVCPACEALLEKPDRYCESCGSDLESYSIEHYFTEAEQHPIAGFVEQALTRTAIDPILARHGEMNWSFYSGSARVSIWCCCSEHVCFSSPLAKPGKQKLAELFRFMLSAEHAPLAFDLDDNLIRLNLTFHISDVYRASAHGDLAGMVTQFVAAADRLDNLLVEQYGCEPAPQTQLTFLKEQAGKTA